MHILIIHVFDPQSKFLVYPGKELAIYFFNAKVTFVCFILVLKKSPMNGWYGGEEEDSAVFFRANLTHRLTSFCQQLAWFHLHANTRAFFSFETEGAEETTDAWGSGSLTRPLNNATQQGRNSVSGSSEISRILD